MAMRPSRVVAPSSVAMQAIRHVLERTRCWQNPRIPLHLRQPTLGLVLETPLQLMRRRKRLAAPRCMIEDFCPAP